jgi:mitochondrial import receptor subunit TOM20
MINKNIVAVVAGGVGLCFLGYCIYFDKKRRSDPDFKRKLRESMRIYSLKFIWFIIYFNY